MVLGGRHNKAAAAAEVWPDFRTRVDAALGGAAAKMVRSDALAALATLAVDSCTAEHCGSNSRIEPVSDAAVYAAAAMRDADEALAVFVALDDARGAARAHTARARAAIAANENWVAWEALLASSSAWRAAGERREAAAALTLRGELMAAAKAEALDDLGKVDYDDEKERESYSFSHKPN